jgi:hypothetical protein
MDLDDVMRPDVAVPDGGNRKFEFAHGCETLIGS